MSVIISLTLSSLVIIFMYYSIFMSVWVFMYRISLNLSLVHYASMFMLYSMNMSVWVYMNNVLFMFLLSLSLSYIRARNYSLHTYTFVCVQTSVCVCTERKRERERDRQIWSICMLQFLLQVNSNRLLWIHSFIYKCMSIHRLCTRKKRKRRKESLIPVCYYFDVVIKRKSAA